MFLHIFREKTEIALPAEAPADGPEKKITRLAIGVEGGFDPNENKRKYEYKDHYNIVVFPEAVKITYPNVDLPLLVRWFLRLVLMNKFEHVDAMTHEAIAILLVCRLAMQ